MKNLIATFILISGLLALVSCNSSSEKTTEAKKIERIDKTTAKEYTSKYICPMHCKGSGSEEPGTCPVCKMDYELNEDYKDAGSMQENGHEGHNHDDHEGHSHDDHEGHNH